jgi:hypothetical protein
MKFQCFAERTLFSVVDWSAHSWFWPDCSFKIRGMLRKFWNWTRFVLIMCSILVGLVFIKGEISRESAAMYKNTSRNTHIMTWESSSVKKS